MTALALPKPLPLPFQGLIALLAALWAGGVILAAQAGLYRQAAGMPPTRILLSILIPVGLAVLAWRLSPRLRAQALAVDPAVIAGLQAFRVAGVVFIFFWWIGQLPTVLAWAAGIGDILVGILGVTTALAIARNAPDWRARSRRLTLLGIADFVMVLVLATLSGQDFPLAVEGQPLPTAMRELPMVLIPAFAVPIFIMLLLITWAQASPARDR